MSAARELVKDLLERLMIGTGVEALGRFAHRGQALILAYHNVVPPGEQPVGDGSLHIRHSRFIDQLDVLAAHSRVVPLSTALESPPFEARRPLVAVTFDDAYAGTLTHAVPALADRGFPATIFVTPGCLGTERFWWDALADPRTRAVPHATREYALAALAGSGERILRWAESAGVAMQTMPSWAAAGSVEMLEGVADTKGLTLGAHTWSHPALPRLPDDALRDELARPLEWLRGRFKRVLPILTYPYGHYSPVVEREAARTGYAAMLRIDGGWIHPGGTQPSSRPRLNIPSGVSNAGFRLRISGILSS
jgi:peptidoglycan/xylan/chitin deacetylase (PgdA/CDA1 family)